MYGSKCSKNQLDIKQVTDKGNQGRLVFLNRHVLGYNRSDCYGVSVGADV